LLDVYGLYGYTWDIGYENARKKLHFLGDLYEIKPKEEKNFSVL